MRGTARSYGVKALRRDAVAGLTVALVAAPQSMAFAHVAGVPAVYGLYTAIVCAIVGGLLTTSSHLVIGPTNTMSLLVYFTVASVGGDPAARIETAVTLTLLVGGIQVLCALAGFGELLRYVSHSVIVGFSAGAGVLIAAGQLPACLGIDISDYASSYHGLAETFDRMMQGTDQVSWRPIAVCLVCLATALACARISRLLPAFLIALAVGTLLVLAAGWSPEHLKLAGDLPRSLPLPAAPSMSWSDWEPHFGSAVAIALIGMIEAVGISKTIAGRTGERIDANQELFAQGLTNLVGSFFRCIPSTGSFSRSALNHAAGGATRFAGVYSGLFVAVVLLTLAPAARKLPMAAIAAILLIIGYRLIDWRYCFRLARGNRADLMVCLGTFLATLTVPLDYAVFVGVFLNIALYLQRARQVYVTELVRDPRAPNDRTAFVERAVRTVGGGRVRFLQLEGNLFFAAADELQDRFRALVGGPAELVILRLKRTHMLDATVMRVIEQFALRMREKDGHVLLCGVRPRMAKRMEGFGLIEVIGEQNVFLADEAVFGSARRALRRAEEIMGRSLDEAEEEGEESLKDTDGQR